VCRAIYFAENETQPRFVWIERRLREDIANFYTLHQINTSTIKYLKRLMGKSIISSTRVRIDKKGNSELDGVLNKSF